MTALVSAFLYLMSPTLYIFLLQDAISIILYYLVTSLARVVSVEYSNLAEGPGAIIRGNCSSCSCHLSLHRGRLSLGLALENKQE